MKSLRSAYLVIRSILTNLFQSGWEWETVDNNKTGRLRTKRLKPLMRKIKKSKDRNTFKIRKTGGGRFYYTIERETGKVTHHEWDDQHKEYVGHDMTKASVFGQAYFSGDRNLGEVVRTTKLVWSRTHPTKLALFS